MELIEYYRLFRRWLWLIIIAAFIGGAFSYISADGRQPVYRASTTLSIGNYISSPNPNTGEIRLGQDLAVTYAELLRTFEVMNATVESLNLSFSPDRLRGLISTRIIPETSLLVVQVQYTDPVITADIANELANQLILLSPTNLTPEQQAQINIAQSQINALRDEVDTLRLELNEVDESLNEAETQAAVDRLISQRNILYEQINERSGNIASFTSTIAEYSQRTNSVEIVETARIPTSPIASSPLQSAILAAIVSASLAGGVVLLIEYMNDTFRSAGEVGMQLGLPMLGVIAKIGKKSRPYQEQLITNDVFSQHFEQYNTLHTNLLFRTSNQKRRAFVITSAMPSEGKTLTAANLAIAMAVGDKKVLLVDSDLRKPKIHDVFNLPNVFGFSNLLKDFKLTAKSNGSDPHFELRIDQNELEGYVHKTDVPNLQVLTTGFTSQNPTSMLSSDLITHWTEAFYELLDVDIVVFDTPPVLVVSDSMVIAERVQANVVLVIEANRTRRSAALKAKERFTDVDYDITGAVLNRADPKDLDYYGYQGYYYYYNEEAAKAKTIQKSVQKEG
jgi:polysaccharide biosynthesis transport protein